MKRNDVSIYIYIYEHNQKLDESGCEWSSNPPVSVLILLDGISPTKSPLEHISCSTDQGAPFKHSGRVLSWLAGRFSSAENELAKCYKKNLF